MVQVPNNKPEGLKPPELTSKPETQELITERVDERQEKPLAEQPTEPSAQVVVPPQSVAALTAPQAKDPDLDAIESILALGLAELYRDMSPLAQEKFRTRGEQTASKIMEMITRAKVKARKVAALIRDWLRLIPGVSHFFLEQETKIKTDRIMEYSEKRKGE
jgi:hypothetical protein